MDRWQFVGTASTTIGVVGIAGCTGQEEPEETTEPGGGDGFEPVTPTEPGTGTGQQEVAAQFTFGGTTEGYTSACAAWNRTYCVCHTALPPLRSASVQLLSSPSA
jgi:hypothetical protein